MNIIRFYFILSAIFLFSKHGLSQKIEVEDVITKAFCSKGYDSRKNIFYTIAWWKMDSVLSKSRFDDGCLNYSICLTKSEYKKTLRKKKSFVEIEFFIKQTMDIVEIKLILKQVDIKRFRRKYVMPVDLKAIIVKCELVNSKWLINEGVYVPLDKLN